MLSLFSDSHSSSSFLNDIDRIASSDYVPSDDDIIRARLRTVGVQELKFVMEESLLMISITFLASMF